MTNPQPVEVEALMRLAGAWVEANGRRVALHHTSTPERQKQHLAEQLLAHDAIESALRKLVEERDALSRALEELTPGGSDFYRSPANCLRFIRETLASRAKLALERNQLRDERDRYREALVKIRDYPQHDFCTSPHAGIAAAALATKEGTDE